MRGLFTFQQSTHFPVGASLLAKAAFQLTGSSTDTTPSRASPLPQGQFRAGCLVSFTSSFAISDDATDLVGKLRNSCSGALRLYCAVF
ncbi:hypothetical protein C1894_16095 [Pseudomonas sp. FW305-3-2-15-E-TSA2]|nr:hypothetical protein C1895_08635 [Pseudomonas sp. FW305-3-2-15-E-TSA4]POA41086.1 hypothetical protein C1894_16095 [Pseudomonas sp. FW305-3-2-15-E-TSA2]